LTLPDREEGVVDVRIASDDREDHVVDARSIVLPLGRPPCCPWGQTLLSATFVRSSVLQAPGGETNVVPATFAQTEVLPVTFL
jgi:hypothetical protein